MIKTIKTFLLLSLALTHTSAVNAEETGALISPPIVNLSIVHHDYMEPEQFGILMKVPDSVTGCYTVSNIEFKTNFIENNYMDVEVMGYKRTPVKTKNVAYDCEVGTKAITAMIPLNINDLKERNIRQIRFKKGSVEDAYTVEITNGNLRLTAKRSVAFQSTGSLTHGISGGGIIALSVPMAQKTDDIAQALRTFAYKNALSPSNQTSPSRDTYYFNDDSGRVSNRFGSESYIELGTISVMRPYNGGQGLQRLPVALKVFAQQP